MEIRNKYIGVEEAYELYWSSNGTFLNLRCDEGYYLDYVIKKDWRVYGLYWSKDGVLISFPELKKKLLKVIYYHYRKRNQNKKIFWPYNIKSCDLACS